MRRKRPEDIQPPVGQSVFVFLWAIESLHCLTNERDFPIPSEPHPVGVAACGNKVPRWRGQTFHQLVLKGEIMVTVTVGIDLAKNVFAVHGVDEAGNPALV